MPSQAGGMSLLATAAYVREVTGLPITHQAIGDTERPALAQLRAAFESQGITPADIASEPEPAADETGKLDALTRHSKTRW